MIAKLTPWFDGSVRPKRIGFYQRDTGDGAEYWRWNGEFWEIGGWRSLFLPNQIQKDRLLRICAGAASLKIPKRRNNVIIANMLRGNISVLPRSGAFRNE